MNSNKLYQVKNDQATLKREYRFTRDCGSSNLYNQGDIKVIYTTQKQNWIKVAKIRKMEKKR